MVKRGGSLRSKNKKNLALSDEDSDDYESVPAYPMKVTRNRPFGYPKPKQHDEEVASESDANDEGFGTCLADGLRMRGKPPGSKMDGRPLGYMNKKNPALTDEDTDDDESESVATHPIEIARNRPFGYPRLKQLDEEVTSESDVNEEGFGTSGGMGTQSVREWDHDPSMENMIGCDNRLCDEKWFTFASIGITVAPDGDWFCSKECREAFSRGSNDIVEEEPEVEGWAYFKT